MNSSSSETDLGTLVDRLVALDDETPWVEFKQDYADTTQIGEYISALANSCALEGRRRGYVLWGVTDKDHLVVGTNFRPNATRRGNEELTNWLLRGLDPQLYFKFHTFEHHGQTMVLLELESASHKPVQFNGVEYIRIGSYKKKLRDHPDHARRLWRYFDNETFESAPALDHLSEGDVVKLIDYPAYFDLMRLPLPENRSLILETLRRDGVVSHDISSEWSISNLGALLFAKDLQNFATLARKATRVVQYRGTSRIETVREQAGQRGYASGFAGLIDYVSNLLPENEVIGQALRTSQLLYPELAIRELIANALVHQDLTIPGSGPMVEIFEDRMEITNPGVPLVQPDRFIDSPPQSRNERLARLTRQMGICEERGSGWDKVTFEIEYHQLPPPLIEVVDVHTRVVLFAPRSLADMEREDRLRAVYQHACLRYVSNQPMTNASVRERFGIASHNSAQASRLIQAAVDAGLITAYDPTVGVRSLRYVPIWADPRRSSSVS